MAVGIDLDRIAQRKAAADGQQLDKKDAIKHIADILGQTIQSSTPKTATDAQAQHQISELKAKIAELEARHQPSSNLPLPLQTPAPKNTPATSPIQNALQGQPQRSITFDPSQLLVTPGSTIPWLGSNQPEALTAKSYKPWYASLAVKNEEQAQSIPSFPFTILRYALRNT